MNHPQILPECYADTLLVEMLGFKPNHVLGIGQVINVMTEKFKNRLAVGIIDNDKRKPTGINTFEIVKEKEGVQYCAKAKTKHTILVINPAFEDWVFENARAVEIDPSKYGFSNRKYFRSICKNANASDNQQLKQFLNTLKQKRPPGFVQIRNWICEGAGIDENDL